MTETLLDDKFKEGVWYDSQAGEFCQIIETDEAIALVEPNGNEETPYFVYGDGNSEEFRPDDFQQVGESAVKDPADYVREYAGLVACGALDTRQPEWSEEINLLYALGQVEIVEQ